MRGRAGTADVGGRRPRRGLPRPTFGDRDAVEEALARGLRARTARPLVRPAALRAEQAATRERGVALDREETFRGVHCVAAPLRGAGRAVAAVSPSSCRGEHEPARPAPAVLACARSVWRELYGPGRAGRASASVPPAAAEPAVSPRAMDNMMGRLRFSEWT
ncbi:IclR family transcriptional regulator C-terminal domain-containing protein [Streptomyces sp. NPDC058623]|uniref:IclR family transcriptional regulator domain-containing protein n=1 Tax=Streptomyces sp. NPDC058623 TaxID=3346563 RepID=UPI0036590BB3